MTDQPGGDLTMAETGSRSLVLSVQDVHLNYRVHSDRRSRLRDRLLRKESSWVDVHAVRGVSFDLGEGESLGIVGANGSGKTSLLRAIAGLLPVSEGRILARSRPVLLGVGAALQAELSGRRNIYLGCLALGMSPREAQGRVEEIVDFSGLRQSIDLPLRTYSSGMRARLHFAIATATVPDLLLIDEIMAAGDAEFRERSGERIRALQQHAGAIVLVTHSRTEVTRTCTRAVWLHEGMVKETGDPEAVFEAYDASLRGKDRKQRQRRGE